MAARGNLAQSDSLDYDSDCAAEVAGILAPPTAPNGADGAMNGKVRRAKTFAERRLLNYGDRMLFRQGKKTVVCGITDAE